MILQISFSSTGAEGGLQLQLNVEQYEYMSGPNSGAGIKILVHNQRQVPLMREFGIALPPGTQGNVGVTLVQVSFCFFIYFFVVYSNFAFLLVIVLLFQLRVRSASSCIIIIIIIIGRRRFCFQVMIMVVVV